ncbi:MAG: DinB family protein [Fimbriimonadaceae bacterium]|nr:DinB family protein [Armatimonadota bacterium]
MSEALLNGLSYAPHVVERILRVFPHERLDERVDPDRYTAREVVAHLAHYEQVVLDRIRAANQQPGRSVPGYDPDAECAEHGYGDKEVFHEAEVFESRRNMTIEYLKDLSESDWDKTFTIGENRTTSIRDYMILILAHDMSHIDQISYFLATEVATLS